MTEYELNLIKDELEYLCETDEIEGPAKGIARLVIDKGMDVLTEKQMEVFQRHVIDKWFSLVCSSCEVMIPFGIFSQVSRTEPRCLCHRAQDS